MYDLFSDPATWLPAVWAGIIGVAVAMYVVLDGFDLGVGILFPWFRREAERDLMMNSVAPFWDGNETWLVLGGGGLLVAFPLAYSVIMPAFYLPVIVMLLALIFRGTAFEFRWVAKPRHRKWDYAFAGGSTLAAFAQGVVLGGLIQGVTVRDNAFAGGPLDWLTPFALFSGVALVLGYALLGATWLYMRVEGKVAVRARRLARPLLVSVMAAMVIVSLWTPLSIERVHDRWFTLPNLFYFAPVPLLTAAAALICWRAIGRAWVATPFLAAIALFLLGYLGLAVSNLPYIVPPSITIWQAAAAPASQLFMLVGTLVLLPLILGYTAMVYWTFRGQVRHGEGYH
jgi:cytochrome d ubiquinol oxidase subunit II